MAFSIVQRKGLLKIILRGIAFAGFLGYNREKRRGEIKMKKLILLLGLSASDRSRVCRALLEKCPDSAWIQAQWCSRTGSSLTAGIRETAVQNMLSLSANYLAREEIGQVFLAFTPEDEPELLLPALLQKLETMPDETQLHAISLEPQSVKVTGLFDAYPLSVIDAPPLSTGQLCRSILARLEEPPQRTLGGKRRKRRFDARALLPLLLLPALLAGLVLGRYLTPQPTALPQPAVVTTVPSVSTTPSTAPPATRPDDVTQDTRETVASSELETADTTQSDSVADYVVNRNSMKFHFPDCPSVEKMKESNREFFTGTRQELLDRGCSPCGSCKP